MRAQATPTRALRTAPCRAPTESARPLRPGGARPRTRPATVSAATAAFCRPTAGRRTSTTQVPAQASARHPTTSDARAPGTARAPARETIFAAVLLRTPGATDRRTSACGAELLLPRVRAVPVVLRPARGRGGSVCRHGDRVEPRRSVADAESRTGRKADVRGVARARAEARTGRCARRAHVPRAGQARGLAARDEVPCGARHVGAVVDAAPQAARAVGVARAIELCRAAALGARAGVRRRIAVGDAAYGALLAPGSRADETCAAEGANRACFDGTGLGRATFHLTALARDDVNEAALGRGSCIAALGGRIRGSASVTRAGCREARPAASRQDGQRSDGHHEVSAAHAYIVALGADKGALIALPSS